MRMTARSARRPTSPTTAPASCARPAAPAASHPNVTYDTAGRTATYNGWFIVYDAEGRLTSACKSTSCSGSIGGDRGYGHGNGDAQGDLCVRPWYWLDCLVARRLADFALSEAQSRYQSSLHNGPGDAFRHCLWMALVAYTCGVGFAKALGNAHEQDNLANHEPWRETQMDLWNNRVGRAYAARLGSWDINPQGTLIRLCASGLSNGDLTWIR
jgi:hypothetical protein